MGRELTQRLHLDFIKASRITSLIVHIVLVIVLTAWLVIAIVNNWTMLPLGIAGGVWLLSFVLFTIIVPAYQYRSFKFDVFEEELEIQSGIIFQKNVLVPMNRVQHVELGSGPIMRHFKLASITVVTAATSHEISGLFREAAEELKVKIGELAKVEEPHE